MPRNNRAPWLTSNRINFRCSPEQEARWIAAAELAKSRDASLTLSSCVRQALDSWALQEEKQARKRVGS